MSCLSSARYADLTEQLTELVEEKDLLRAQLLANQTGVESYKFESGDGSQQTKYMSPIKLTERLTVIRAEMRRIKSLLRGTGLVSVVLRRKGGDCRFFLR